MLLSRFLPHLSDLVGSHTRLLLAVSGGRDSVVLEDLCHRAKRDYVIAHCNFHLRPKDCDRDEQFVRDLAQRHGVPCFVAQFDTQVYAAERHLSIEDAARQLRYKFFQQIRQQEHLAYILTAHHRDDSIETFFLNLLRGTGIAGLHGIRPVNGFIVRPLLPFGRDEIDAYVQEHNLAYVEDSTNALLQFRRNQVRHQLMPLLRELAQGIDASMQQTISHIADVETVYRNAIDSLRQRLFHKVEEAGEVATYEILVSDIEELRPQETLMYEFLSPYGFNITQVRNIISTLKAPSGRQFLSPTHIIVKDRDKFILTSRPCFVREDDGHDLANRAADGSSSPAEDAPSPLIKTTILNPPADLAQLKTWSDATHAYFDADKIVLPIHLRHWQKGDRFFPFGMVGSQLLSDYFSDHKFTLLDKQRQWLLVDASGVILWLVGHRTDQRCKVTPRTTRMLEVVVS